MHETEEERLLDNYAFLTPRVEIKKANLYWASTGAVLVRASNAAAVSVTWSRNGLRGDQRDLRDAGQDVSANMYPYIAGATALASSLPPWVAEGGTDKLLQRLHDPAIRENIKKEMATEHPDWEEILQTQNMPTESVSVSRIAIVA